MTMLDEGGIFGLPEVDGPVAKLLPPGWLGLLIGDGGAGSQLLAKQYACVGLAGSPVIYYSTYERPDDVQRVLADYGWKPDGLVVTNLSEQYQSEVLDRELDISKARERGIRYADLVSSTVPTIPSPVPKPTARLMADVATLDTPFRIAVDSLDFLLEVLPSSEVVALARQLRRRCQALNGQALLLLYAEGHDRRVLALLEDMADLVLDLRSMETKDGFRTTLTIRKVRNHPEQTRRVPLAQGASGFSVASA